MYAHNHVIAPQCPSIQSMPMAPFSWQFGKVLLSKFSSFENKSTPKVHERSHILLQSRHLHHLAFLCVVWTVLVLFARGALEYENASWFKDPTLRGGGHISRLVKNQAAGNDLGGPVILPQWERSWGQFLEVSNIFLQTPTQRARGRGLPYHTNAICNCPLWKHACSCNILSFEVMSKKFLNGISPLRQSWW